MKHTLTSISEHSDFLENTEMCYQTKWTKHRTKVEFGKKDLNIGQFIPAVLDGGVWRVLDKPKIEEYQVHNSSMTLVFHGPAKEKKYNQLFTEYQKALENVLFTGFVLNYQDKFVTTVSFGNERGSLKINFKSKNIFIHRDRLMVKTIEDLVKYNLELSSNAVNILKLEL